jgi:hypothetical protein
MRVIHGCGVEHERGVPFGMTVDMLAPHLQEPLPADRFRAQRVVRSLLEQLGRERPLALALDDLHWADDASLELVLHLLRRPPESAQLLVLAARPGAAAERLVEAALGAPGWEALTPAPLSDADALKLLDGVPDLDRRRRIVADARGNPLFLRELAHSGPGNRTGAPQRAGPAADDAVRVAGDGAPRAVGARRGPAGGRGRRGDARLQAIPTVTHFALWIRALVHEARGERHETERLVREAAALAGAVQPSKRSFTAAVDLAAIDAAHDPARALREMVEADGPELSRTDPTTRCAQFLRLVRVALALVRIDDAAAFAARATAHGDRLRLPVAASRATCAR